MHIWPAVCCIDPCWKKRMGPEWKESFKEILKESSQALEDIAGFRLALLDAVTWPIPRFRKTTLDKHWRAKRKELREYYTKCYGYNLDEEELMGIFLLNLARMHLIRFSYTLPYRNKPCPPILHLGFVGSLYWFDLPEKPYLEGGGISSVSIPFVIVNFDGNKNMAVHAVVHEILHLFGAHHNEKGVMKPHGHETSPLDHNNKMFVEKSVKDFLRETCRFPAKKDYLSNRPNPNKTGRFFYPALFVDCALRSFFVHKRCGIYSSFFSAASVYTFAAFHSNHP